MYGLESVLSQLLFSVSSLDLSKDLNFVKKDFKKTKSVNFFDVYECSELSGWMISGERQAARIRSLYLKTILRQDIAFFDIDTNTGEVVGRMSGDTVLIQDAMGEKVSY